MTRISQNFKMSEFAVSKRFPHLVKPVPPEFEPFVMALVAGALQPLRSWWGHDFVVNSGYRTKELNAALRGSPTSQHLRAQAADIVTHNVEGLFRALVEADEVGAWSPLPKAVEAVSARAAAGDPPPDVSKTLGQVIWYPSRGFIHFATPSIRYPLLSFFVNDARLELDYEPIKTIAGLEGLLHVA